MLRIEKRNTNEALPSLGNMDYLLLVNNGANNPIYGYKKEDIYIFYAYRLTGEVNDLLEKHHAVIRCGLDKYEIKIEKEYIKETEA